MHSLLAIKYSTSIGSWKEKMHRRQACSRTVTLSFLSAAVPMQSAYKYIFQLHCHGDEHKPSAICIQITVCECEIVSVNVTTSLAGEDNLFLELYIMQSLYHTVRSNSHYCLHISN